MKNIFINTLFIFLVSICLMIQGCTNTGTTGGAADPPDSVPLPTSDADNGGIQLPDQFGAALVVDSLGKNMRHMQVAENGDIYVLRRGRGEEPSGIVALRDSDDDGKADQTEVFGDFGGTGLAIHNGYLYASSPTEVYRFKMQAGELVPNTKYETMVTGFPDQRSHDAKTMAFDQDGNMYVNVGAPSNACQEQARTKGSPGKDPCPQLEWQAGIWRFKADQPNQDQQKDGLKYATGIRNSVAIEWNNQANSLYVVQHGRDGLFDLWGEHYTLEDQEILPAEEFLQVSQGDDFGWPYCYYDQVKGKKMLAPEYGGTGSEQGRCEGIKEPILGFPGHIAPNDLIFYTGDQFPEKYRQGAFIAFHGSWNRAPKPQSGYFVVFVPMKDGKPDGEWEIFAEGFPQVEEVKSPNDAVYRPMALAQGPDGSLYISDSRKGRIWRVMYYGKQMAVN